MDADPLVNLMAALEMTAMSGSAELVLGDDRTKLDDGCARALARMAARLQRVETVDCRKLCPQSGCIKHWVEAIARLPSLRHLCLPPMFDDEWLVALAEVSRCLTRLESLALSDSILGPIGTKRLAAALPDLMNLDTLAFSGTKGAELIVDYIKPESISDNALFTLISADGPWHKLRSLRIWRWDLWGHRMEAITTLLHRCTALQTLDLRSNGIGPAEARLLASALRAMPELSSLNVSHNALGDQGFTTLLEYLSRSSSLRALKVSGIGIGAGCGLADPSHHDMLGQLTSLNVAENPELLDSADACSALLCRLGSVQQLDISHTGITDVGYTALKTAGPILKGITDFGLAGNAVESKGLSATVEAIQHWPRLAVLDLANNELDRDLTPLSLVLGPGSSLSTLRLSCNRIGDEGMGELSRVLGPQCSLRTLDLRANEFGDAGLQAFAQACKGGRLLECLNLTANDIGDDGVAHLIANRHAFPLLRELRLDCTQMSEFGVISVLTALRLPPWRDTLRYIGLDCIAMFSFPKEMRDLTDASAWRGYADMRSAACCPVGGDLALPSLVNPVREPAAPEPDTLPMDAVRLLRVLADLRRQGRKMRQEEHGWRTKSDWCDRAEIDRHRKDVPALIHALTATGMVEARERGQWRQYRATHEGQEFCQREPD